MTKEIAKNIVRGITDKIKATTDIDDWAEFWGFTQDDYKEFLEIPTKPLKQESKTGYWIETGDYFSGAYEDIDYVKCSCCNEDSLEEGAYCPNCGVKMIGYKTMKEYYKGN